MLAFAADPVAFVNRWIDSQAHDLDAALGETQANAEVMRRAEFYKQQWVAEGVMEYLVGK